MRIYLDGNEGFMLNGVAHIIPQDYVDRFMNGELEIRGREDFDRVIDRTSKASLINMAPAYARVTENNSLILKTY